MALLTNCPQCAAELATEGFDETTQARCAACGAQFALDGFDENTSTKNTKATLSAVLGSVSFLGLILTGIPAVILGWQALKDIKQRKTNKGRRRALVGIVTGSVFGLGCGCGAAGLAVIIPYAWPSEDPAVIQSVMDEIGRTELPEQVQPTTSQRFVFMNMVTYQDPGKTSTILSVFYPTGLARTEDMARGQAQSLRTSMTLSPHTTHQVQAVAGPLEVTEERGTRKGEPVHVYSGLVQHPDGWVATQIMIKKDRAVQGETDAKENPRYEMTLDEILHAFATYKVPGQ